MPTSAIFLLKWLKLKFFDQVIGSRQIFQRWQWHGKDYRFDRVSFDHEENIIKFIDSKEKYCFFSIHYFFHVCCIDVKTNKTLYDGNYFSAFARSSFLPQWANLISEILLQNIIMMHSLQQFEFVVNIFHPIRLMHTNSSVNQRDENIRCGLWASPPSIPQCV